MKKLRLHIDRLVVESFTIPSDDATRGTVEGLESCNTCQDLDCSAVCTGTSCGDTGGGTGTTQYGGTCDTPCGPGGSADWAGCSTGYQGCQTLYGWTGCDYSCIWGPCGSDVC